MSTPTARQAATAHLQQAGEAINTMFDRQDDVAAKLAEIAEIAASYSNVFTRTQQVVAKATELATQLEELRDAANAASEHRAKRDLAKDLGSSPTVVFSTHRSTDTDDGEPSNDDSVPASNAA